MLNSWTDFGATGARRCCRSLPSISCWNTDGCLAVTGVQAITANFPVLTKFREDSPLFVREPFSCHSDDRGEEESVYIYFVFTDSSLTLRMTHAYSIFYVSMFGQNHFLVYARVINIKVRKT